MCDDKVFFPNGCVSWRDWVNDFFVSGPDDCPVEVDNIFARALGEYKLSKGLGGHASPADSPDSGEPGIVPTPDKALVDKPVQLALAQ